MKLDSVWLDVYPGEKTINSMQLLPMLLLMENATKPYNNISGGNKNGGIE